jgi:hypothetical protein
MDARKRSAPAGLGADLDEESLDALEELDEYDDRDPYEPRPRPSLDGFSLAGITRRRMGWLVVAFLSAWIVLVFARQVADTAAKGAEAERARTANAEVAQNVVDLQRELVLIQQQAFITQQAHGLGLGVERDHAFVLAPDAPPLADDAPGSAAVRLGGPAERPSPLESWLSILFGPPGD